MATAFYRGSDSVCHGGGKVSRECGRGDRGVSIMGTRRWIFQSPKGLRSATERIVEVKYSIQHIIRDSLNFKQPFNSLLALAQTEGRNH